MTEESPNDPPSPLPWDRRTGESPEAHEALRAYLDAGPGRSLSGVAATLGKNPSLLKRWSAEHQWVARSEALDSHNARIERAAADRVRAARVAEWERRKTQECQDLYALALELRAKARSMLKFPLARASSEDGKTIIKPANWTLATVVAVTRVSADLAAAAITEGMADDGFDPLTATPEECREWLKAQLERRAVAADARKAAAD